jgi:choline dehydrogenase-like flavoprotein
MQWLSEGAEALVDRVRDNRTGGARLDFDAVVVGSGYGGAVAACRLAEAGYSVCVLERGEEYVPGEFPNDLSNLPNHIRFERADRAAVMGSRSGLFDLRVHGKITTLVGNALGGGSQINANVALRADSELFKHQCWPEELRDAYDPLDSYCTRVETMLDARPYLEPCTKADQLARLAGPLGAYVRKHHWRDADVEPQVRFYRPPLAVTCRDDQASSGGVRQKKCTGCGDCVTGCNVGAKNTLTMNYLPLATRHGAKLYTGVTVLGIDPRTPDRAIAYFTYTDYDLERVLPAGIRDLPGCENVFAVTAKFVILAAGTLGSTEILLRSRELELLTASPRLGTGFSTNGDGLHFGFDQNEEVNAVGWGADRERYALGKPPGPSIVSVLDVRGGQPARDGVLLEDGIVPGALVHATHEFLTTVGTLAQLDAWRFKRSGRGEDALALNDDALRRTQVYLGIGHDDASGIMRLKHRRVFVSWDGTLGQPCLQRQEAYLGVAARRSTLHATCLVNPTLQPVPPALRSVLSGPPVEGTAIVAHPLGGCPMGEDFERGVVDHMGALYNGATPRSTYRTLYVWDGSILPCSLGVNPFLTIAALAERAAEKLIALREDVPGATAPHPAPQLPALEPLVTEIGAVDVVLKETMRGRLRCHAPHGFPADEGAEVDAALHLTVGVNDMVRFLGGCDHPVGKVGGFLQVAGDAPANRIEVLCGKIELLEPCGAFWLGRIWRTIPALAAWFVKRGRVEVFRYIRDRNRGKKDSCTMNEYVAGVLRQAYHSGERREIRYELELGRDGMPQFKLKGAKALRYSCNSNVWDSLLDLPVEICRNGHLVADGGLRLDLMALTDEDFPQVQGASDLPNALAALASLPLFFLRVVLKAQLWDFKAPDYAPRTLRAPLEEQRPELIERARWRPVPGVDPVWLYPERHWISVDAGRLPGPSRIPLLLTRFKAPGAQAGIHDARRTPLLLLHGFCQSSRAFVAEPLEQDLLGHLLERNYDVWLLDYRISTALPSGSAQCLLDDVALHDLPEAVDYVLQAALGDGWAPASGKRQVMALGHCMGAATLAMSLLAGHLHDKHTGCKIRAAVLSQVPPFVVGGYYSLYRQHLVAFLRDAIGLRHIDLAADDAANAWEVVMDRLFATLPLACEHEPYGKRVSESCLDEHDSRFEVRTDLATCRRISGIIGMVYVHDNVRKTHRLMHHYFGRGSISVFAQIAKFFEYEQLVSADGANAYVNDPNIQTRLDLPLALLHGGLNQVFNIESARRSCEQINRVHASTRRCELMEIGGYGHFDCLVGDRAPTQVFPRVSAFLQRN